MSYLAPKATITSIVPPKESTLLISEAPKSHVRASTSPSPTAVATSPSTPQAPPISQPSASEAPSSVVPVEQADPRLIELARKESLLRTESKRIAAERAELESLRSSKPVGMTAEEWKARFLEDPTTVGMTYEEMANRYLTQPSETDQKYKAMEAKLAELEGKLGQSAKSMEEAEAQAYQNAINQFKADTKQLVESNPEDYELIAVEGAHDQVAALIEATYHEDKRLMSVKEAAQRVEEYLVERALKYAGLNKVKAKTQPTQSAPTAQSQTRPQGTPQQTLSHTMATGSRPPAMSRAELIERAKAAFHGQKQ